MTDKKALEPKRFLEKNSTVFHDLYRLDVATTRKNLSFSDEPGAEIWEPVEHKHWYHSCDSSGKVLNTSAPTAGHFHEVKTFIDKNGNLAAECGPPQVFVGKKKYPYKNDKHTHSVTYLNSEEVQKRQSSAEAVASMSLLMKDESEAQKNVTGVIR